MEHQQNQCRKSKTASHVLKSMEKLLLEAQKESAQSSALPSGLNSHSISPISPCSPFIYAGESPVSAVEAMLMNKVRGRHRK